MTTVRRAGTVSAAALSGLGLTLGLAHAIAPQWAARTGLDVWNIVALHESAKTASEEYKVLLAKEERIRREIEAGEHIAARLVDGSLALADAIKELEPTLRDRPGFDFVCESTYQAPTFRHGVARYAIGRVTRLLKMNPAQRAVVCARLETEYAAIK